MSYVEMCNNIRPLIKSTIVKCLERGDYFDSLTKSQVCAIVFNEIGFDFERKQEFNYVLTTIREEMFAVFGEKESGYKKHRESRPSGRLYRGIRAKDATILFKDLA